MSSLSTLNPLVRPAAVRAGVVAVFAAFLVALGFLVPFWIVLTVAVVLAGAVRAARAVRTASAKVDRILVEELGPNGSAR